MENKQIAELIEEYSEQLCVDRIGHVPHTWYTGGDEHNDDRLTARVEDGNVRVSDGNHVEWYQGDRTKEAVCAYVEDWLANLWERHD